MKVLFVRIIELSGCEDRVMPTVAKDAELVESISVLSVICLLK